MNNSSIDYETEFHNACENLDHAASEISELKRQLRIMKGNLEDAIYSRDILREMLSDKDYLRKLLEE